MARSLSGDEFYNCEACEKAPYKLEQLGHDGEPQGAWDLNLLTDVPIPRCPVRLLQLAKPELRREILRWKDQYYPLFRKGQLLVPGGIAAQPARWLEAMLFLESIEKRQETKFVEIRRKEDEGSDK